MAGDKKTHFGRAGEFYAMSELLLRGWNVAVPVVDVGDDVFVIDDRDKTTWRVQVKSATVNVKTAEKPPGKTKRTAQITISRKQLASFDEIDLFYFFLLREDNDWTWYIVPREALAEIREKSMKTPRPSGKAGAPAKEDKDAKTDALALTFTFNANGEAEAWGTSFSTYKRTWPDKLGVIKDGPGSNSTTS